MRLSWIFLFFLRRYSGDLSELLDVVVQSVGIGGGARAVTRGDESSEEEFDDSALLFNIFGEVVALRPDAEDLAELLVEVDVDLWDVRPSALAEFSWVVLLVPDVSNEEMGVSLQEDVLEDELEEAANDDGVAELGGRLRGGHREDVTTRGAGGSGKNARGGGVAKQAGRPSARRTDSAR